MSLGLWPRGEESRLRDPSASPQDDTSCQIALPHKKRVGLAMTVLFSLFSLNPPVSAAEPVRVTITVLTASNEGSDFNLDNDEYRDQLIKLFSYSSYEQSERFLVDLEKGVRQKMALAEGYELMLTLQGAENGRVLVQALIRKDGQQYVDTVLSILRPGVVFLGGPPAGSGSLIIVLETGL